MESRLGIVTVGQTPREELVSDFTAVCANSKIHILGALDGTSEEERQRLLVEAGQYPIRCQLRDGREIAIGKNKLLPKIQECISMLEAEAVEAIVLGCNSNFPPFKHSVPLLKPAEVANRIVIAMSAQLKLGCIVPLAEQVPNAIQEFADEGVECIALAASPGQPTAEVIKIAQRLEDMGANLIYLRCFGFNSTWKQTISAVVGIPVVSPVTLTASVASALLS